MPKTESPHDRDPVLLDLKAHPVRTFDGQIYFYAEGPGRSHTVRLLEGVDWVLLPTVGFGFVRGLERAELPAGVEVPKL